MKYWISLPFISSITDPPLAFSSHSEIAAAYMVGERCSYAGHICAGVVFVHRDTGVSLRPARKPLTGFLHPE